MRERWVASVQKPARSAGFMHHCDELPGGGCVLCAPRIEAEGG